MKNPSKFKKGTNLKERGRKEREKKERKKEKKFVWLVMVCNFGSTTTQSVA